MSTIHDALKSAQAKQNVIQAAPVAVSKKSHSSHGLWWFMLVLFLTESGLFFRESQLRKKAEEKMRQAFLELNDEREKSQELLREKVGFEGKLAATQNQREEALREITALTNAKQEVEVDNLEKEKKISQMTKNLHELEMKRLQLMEEAKSLRSLPSEVPAQN